MIIHDSDFVRIIDEADGKKFLTVDSGFDVLTIEIDDRTLEDLFEDLVSFYEKKDTIDANTLAELSRAAETKDSVLKIR